jgi:monovalent cation:H+ antiporter, CPA1 family
MAEQHVLWWGGLRGALALALALSLPHTVTLRDEIVVATFGVVVFSIVIQGLTMPPLLRRLGFLPQKV